METFTLVSAQKNWAVKNCCPHRAGAYGGRVLVAAPGRVPDSTAEIHHCQSFTSDFHAACWKRFVVT